MADTGKILKGGAIVAILGLVTWKTVSFYKKVKAGVGNITPTVSFLRIHGLIGDGLTKFISPVIRTLFNLNIKNFSGFDISVTKIYARIETQKQGKGNWSVIATTSSYLSIAVKDGISKDIILTIDFKGLGTISSLIIKSNRHRIVLTYDYKGQTLQTIQDVDISGPINSYWQKAKGALSLKGITISQTMQPVI